MSVCGNVVRWTSRTTLVVNTHRRRRITNSFLRVYIHAVSVCQTSRSSSKKNKQNKIIYERENFRYRFIYVARLVLIAGWPDRGGGRKKYFVLLFFLGVLFLIQFPRGPKISFWSSEMVLIHFLLDHVLLCVCMDRGRKMQFTRMIHSAPFPD